LKCGPGVKTRRWAPLTHDIRKGIKRVKRRFDKLLFFRLHQVSVCQPLQIKRKRLMASLYKNLVWHWKKDEKNQTYKIMSMPNMFYNCFNCSDKRAFSAISQYTWRIDRLKRTNRYWQRVVFISGKNYTYSNLISSIGRALFNIHLTIVPVFPNVRLKKHKCSGSSLTTN